MNRTIYIRKIDKTGRVVIPIKIRNRLNYEEDQKLLLREFCGNVLIYKNKNYVDNYIELLLYLFHACYGNDYEIIYNNKMYKSKYNLIKSKIINSVNTKLYNNTLLITEYGNSKKNNESIQILKKLLQELIKNDWNNIKIVLYYFH